MNPTLDPNSDPNSNPNSNSTRCLLASSWMDRAASRPTPASRVYRVNPSTHLLTHLLPPVATRQPHRARQAAAHPVDSSGRLASGRLASVLGAGPRRALLDLSSIVARSRLNVGCRQGGVPPHPNQVWCPKARPTARASPQQNAQGGVAVKLEGWRVEWFLWIVRKHRACA
eukprot:scaffold8377_cov58-Phaeocystis_antarctica.AAC.5